jgi:GNAT superfamily N-acetyltransferase
MKIRAALPDDLPAMLEIVDRAAQAYRGVIPPDCWHEPYMPETELRQEIADGIEFWLAEVAGAPAGMMGIQDRDEVALVRHAYDSPDVQRVGVGTGLLHHVEALTTKPILIGTWAAATWAIAFYRRNGYAVVTDTEKNALLRRFWSVPERQIETSVVLADRRWVARSSANPGASA